MASRRRRVSRVRKALKLEVAWPGGTPRPLCVKNKDGTPFKVYGHKFQPEHVDTSGNVVLVKDFFGDDNKIRDASRYSIQEGVCRVRHNGRDCICSDRYIIPHCNHTGEAIYDCDIFEQDLGQHLQQQPGSIVLLLESPHKDEYGRNITVRKAPAAGRRGSGGNIARCLDTVLMHIQIETGLIMPGCHVVISNPVQFQTSLHAALLDEHRKELDNTLRDNVWRTLWDEPCIKQCFLTRLGRYHPKVIINACTGKLDQPKDLKRLVNDFVHANLPLVPLFAVAHPASWQDLRPKRFNPPANHGSDST